MPFVCARVLLSAIVVNSRKIMLETLCLVFSQLDCLYIVCSQQDGIATTFCAITHFRSRSFQQALTEHAAIVGVANAKASFVKFISNNDNAIGRQTPRIRNDSNYFTNEVISKFQFSFTKLQFNALILINILWFQFTHIFF